jgi:hypothetical protein
VFAVCLKKTTGPVSARNIKIMSIEACGTKAGAPYFWSLLSMDAEKYRSDFIFEFEDDDGGEDEGEESGGDNRGRPRLHAKFGPELLEFVRTYIQSKGQVNIESHRLRSTGEVLVFLWKT